MMAPRRRPASSAFDAARLCLFRAVSLLTVIAAISLTAATAGLVAANAHNLFIPLIGG
ncbi:hypothetical protein [Sphingosinicella terrae]|uniref:hypothetical protein n=1 Tax=Sphingosinicella terrae TaxID=2172047 RepID=UPI0013B3B9F4|nr:hypothetical protein [Sphingosinicella terrae]